MAKKDDPQFRIRLPADLKGKIEDAAKQNGRSLNSEIERRLDNSFKKKTIYSPWVHEDYEQEVIDAQNELKKIQLVFDSLPENCDPIERAIIRYEIMKKERKLESTKKYLKQYQEETEFLGRYNYDDN